jgi:hypothetical protein
MADSEDLTEEVEFEEEETDEELDPEELDPEELDEVLVEEEDDEFVAIGEDEDGLPADVEGEGEEEEDEEAEPAARRATGDDEEDDDELLDADDIEADLDTILKERLVAAEEEPDDEEDEVEVDERGEPLERLQPRRPGEFVCQSCFLVKHPSQLADANRLLCTDCV